MWSESSDSSLSGDELETLVLEELHKATRPRLAKQIQIRPDFFTKLSEREFFKRFRITKETARRLLEDIRPEISSPTGRNHAISAETKLSLTLRFFATGAFLQVVADIGGVSVTAAHSIVRCVTAAIARRGDSLIRLPTVPEAQEEQIKFQTIANFPLVVGVIDCTHIRIQSPGGPRAEEFRNRKGYFSYNVQCVCDADLRIRDIVARWPGSNHDQHILNNSRLRELFESGAMGNGLLLGDSGYRIKSYLMTPVRNAATAPEISYNESLTRTRNVIERCFGVWKRRFPVSSLGIRLSRETSSAVVVATAVLHNMAINAREEDPPVEVEVEEEEDEPENEDNAIDMPRDAERRALLINNYFANLV